MIIDIERVIDIDNTALIILAQTGIFYECQCGGRSCHHNQAEGYVLNLYSFANGLTGCNYSCSYLQYLPDELNKFANDFNQFCIKITDRWTYRIRFDFDRINETMEAWIPVVLNGELDGNVFENTKAFIHNGNCD